jgi:hypothetical protein
MSQQKLYFRSGTVNRTTIDVSEWQESEMTIDELKIEHGQFVFSMVVSGKAERIYKDDSKTDFTEYKLAGD